MAALSRVSEIPRMEVCGEKDQRHVDGGQVAREPAGQVDVRDRAALGADAFRDLGQGRNPFAVKTRVLLATTPVAAQATFPFDG